MKAKKEAYLVHQAFKKSGIDDFDSSLCVMEMLFNLSAWRDAS